MYDFCINGGGMVGASLALGLAQQGYHIALVETTVPAPFESNSGPDLRVSAISEHSVDILRALGAWKHIEAMRVKPYTGLAVWEDEGSETVFSAESVNLPQLGYFVENRILQLGCYEALKGYDNVTWYTQSPVASFDFNAGDASTLTLADGTTVEAQWVVGADGARSAVRMAADIGTSGWQYEQQALGVTVKMHQPVEAVTWQRFYPSGPRAFLPMYDNFASLIWYDDANTVAELKGLSNEALKARILSAFPDRLMAGNNDFTIQGKAAFPLTRSHASAYVTPSVILAGDAAHTINPLAGQGVNLGFRDIESLLALTAGNTDISQLAFYRALKAKYEKPRQRDNALMMAGMDSFYLLFSNNSGPLKWIRNQLLTVADKVKPAKREVLKYALGLNQWKF
ncbi:FAD-dependent monooxygenase [Alteromonas antoniana]|uniref:FAD-dependent monooxygenase n=1 Tax=Alteromonas antoniana TaxID=2803813 RepID=UPI001C450A9E|nr:FAD-dependent monooxygenase [Alteromonas antoniana]